jgi:transposase-like protein
MRYNKEEKALWIEDWQQSGQGSSAYAKSNGLNPQTFERWIKTESETETEFIEVQVPEIPTANQRSEILIEKGNMRIHIAAPLGCNELRAVMEGLGGLA